MILDTRDNPIMCNISDGIMFQIINRNEKFLSISAVGNRLLFHLSKNSTKRDDIFNKYKVEIPELYRYTDIQIFTQIKKTENIIKSILN